MNPQSSCGCMQVIKWPVFFSKGICRVLKSGKNINAVPKQRQRTAKEIYFQCKTGYICGTKAVHLWSINHLLFTRVGSKFSNYFGLSITIMLISVPPIQSCIEKYIHKMRMYGCSWVCAWPLRIWVCV